MANYLSKPPSDQLKLQIHCLVEPAMVVTSVSGHLNGDSCLIELIAPQFLSAQCTSPS